MIFTIFLLVCVISVIYIYKNLDKNYWKKRNVVEVDEVLVGKFLRGNRSIGEVYKQIYDDHPNEPYIGTFFGLKKALIVKDLQNIQSILASNFECFHNRGITINKSDLLADNVLFMEDYERWKLVRQKVSPVFTAAKLKNMYYIIEKTARDFVEMIKERKDMRDVPFNAMYTFSTASIGASVFGIDTQLRSTMDSPFLEMAWKSVSPSLMTNLRAVISSISPTLFRLLNLKLLGEHEDFFLGVVKNVLNVRRQGKKQTHDFIDMCVELQKNGTMKDHSTGYELEPTDELLGAQAFFFFIAGADTSSNTLHFSLLELASNPDILQRLHDELDTMFKENDQITYDIIEKQQYLDMVVSEALRKFPPISVMQRQCTKDTVLPVGNLKIEKDVMLIIPLYAIHRDEKNFPNPEKFDPERFAPENVAKIPKMAYIPFSEGKRMCLGARYAKVQVKTGLAFLLKTFTLRHQTYKPHFEKSIFSLRDADAKYELILRD